MNTLLEALFLNSIAIWFAYFLLIHAELTAKVRGAILSALPAWLQSLATCPLCLSFWALAVDAFFIHGFTPMLFWLPPCVLFIDLAYRRLRPTSQ